jgi:hypothetical protein
LLCHGESRYETGQRAGQHPTFEFQRGGHNSLPSNQFETAVDRGDTASLDRSRQREQIECREENLAEARSDEG